MLFAEECVEWGSIGEHLAYCLQQAGWNGTFLHAAVHTANLPHATVPQIKQVTGLDADTLAQQVMDAWMKGETYRENSVGSISGSAWSDPEP